MEEQSTTIADVVYAEMVECVPDPPSKPEPLPTPPDVTPVQQAQQATIEQTGADPPPKGGR